ncbi:MAG TPA: isoprenylcysteine carboxylmethyltransferase family protein [Bacteroidales bacterium]|nr:isoprenylcysteine carboxylmethyltransferase family protein [Bacteroidales bacterium]
MQTIIYLSVLFGVSELALTLFKHTKTGSVKVKDDKGSLVVLWILMISCITIGFNTANYSEWSFTNYVLASAGVSIYLAGLVIRWKSIVQLKKRFTVNVAVNKVHKLETEGMYRYLRHPSYSGLLLILAGLGLAMNSYISFFVVLVPVFLGLNYRISVEENLLAAEFGNEYDTFRASRKKIIPFIY